MKTCVTAATGHGNERIQRACTYLCKILANINAQPGEIHSQLVGGRQVVPASADAPAPHIVSAVVRMVRRMMLSLPRWLLLLLLLYSLARSRLGQPKAVCARSLADRRTERQTDRATHCAARCNTHNRMPTHAHISFCSFVSLSLSLCLAVLETMPPFTKRDRVKFIYLNVHIVAHTNSFTFRVFH